MLSYLLIHILLHTAWFGGRKKLDTPPCSYSLSMVQGAWWNYSSRQFAVEGGCILMKCASKTLLEVVQARDRNAAISAITKDLIHAHDCKIVHTDIRPANIMLFDYGWQLADWGLSGSAGSLFHVQRGSSRSRRAGPRVREQLLLNKYVVKWDACDDWEMLIHLDFPHWSKDTSV